MGDGLWVSGLEASEDARCRRRTCPALTSSPRSFDRGLAGGGRFFDPEKDPLPSGRTLLLHRPRLIRTVRDLEYLSNRYPRQNAEELTQNVLSQYSNCRLILPVNLVAVFRCLI